MSINPSRNVNIPTPHTQMPPSQSCEDFDPTLQQTSRPVARVTSVQLTSYNDDIDIDELNAIEVQFENPIKRAQVEQSFKPEKKMKMDTVNRIEDYPDDIDLLVEEDEDYLREIEADIIGNVKEIPKGPIGISSDPYVFIKQIKDLSESENVGKVFRVKAQIMKLLSKLSVGKDGWSLKCTIVDGTGCLDVEFTSEVLSKLVGYTPQEMNQLKRDMASKPELKDKALSVSIRPYICVIYASIRYSMILVL